MTGEVTLRGNVLPIGGLREKTMAAHRSDIRRIILPKNNLRDLDEIPESVKDKMKFIPVKTVDEVLEADDTAFLDDCDSVVRIPFADEVSLLDLVAVMLVEH